MSVVLCGLPMSGKTTYGKLLAKRLGWDFVDIDERIEKKQGKTCRRIYYEQGERTFRDLEKKEISSLIGLKKCVIAAGGGSFNDPDNVKVLRSLGCVLYLKTDPMIVWDRMCQKGLPAFLSGKQEFDALVKARVPIYRKVAHFVYNGK